MRELTKQDIFDLEFIWRPKFCRESLFYKNYDKYEFDMDKPINDNFSINEFRFICQNICDFLGDDESFFFEDIMKFCNRYKHCIYWLDISRSIEKASGFLLMEFALRLFKHKDYFTKKEIKEILKKYNCKSIEVLYEKVKENDLKLYNQIIMENLK